VGVRREPRPDPGRLAGVDAFPEASVQLAARRDAPADARGVGLRQCACVAVAPDRHDRGELLDLETVELGHERELLVARLADGDHVEPLDLDARARMGARSQRVAVDLRH